MSFPTIATVLDNFNRAAIGANWTNSTYGDGALAISGSTVLASSGGFCAGYLNTANYGPGIEFYADVIAYPASSFMGLMYHLNSGGTDAAPNGYEFNAHPENTTASFDRIDAGVNTTIGAAFTITAGFVYVAGDKIGVSVSSGVHSFYLFTSGAWGAAITTRSDSTYTSGHFGFELSTGNQVDNMSGGTISSGGTVYSKSNTGTAPATASGADQSVWVEQGTGTAPGAASGAKNFLTNKPGTATAPHTASGADQSVWVEQGAGTATATSSGADNFVTADSGTATVPAVASGADQTVFVEQGTGAATAAGSGADNFLTADSGADTSTATANGADQTVWVETGTAASPFTASGASQLLHPGGNVYDRTGTGTLTTTASGDTSIVWAEAGTGAAPGTAGGDLGAHGGMGSWVPFADIYMGGPDTSVKVSHGEPIGLPTEERWRRERAAEREQERAQARLDEENLIELLMLL